MPRPTKLTPKLQERIVGFVRAGAYVETAAAAAGISKETLYSWLRRGAADEVPFAAFAEAVEEAQALAEMRDLALIGKAAETEWTAAAWRLERKFPDRYGRRTKHEVSGLDGGPIAHEHRHTITPDALSERIDALAARLTGEAPGSDARALAGGDEPGGTG